MSFWTIHGLNPGPLHRPLLAGTIAGGLASLPAAALVWWSGAALPPSRALGWPPAILVLASVAGLIVAGTAYGAVFRRAANDPRGGWLFGLGWGLGTWAAGPITACQWLLGRPIATGAAATVLLAGHLLWGFLLGIGYPSVQRWVQMDIDQAPPPRRYRRDGQPHTRSPRRPEPPGGANGFPDPTPPNRQPAREGESHGDQRLRLLRRTAP